MGIGRNRQQAPLALRCPYAPWVDRYPGGPCSLAVEVHQPVSVVRYLERGSCQTYDSDEIVELRDGRDSAQRISNESIELDLNACSPCDTLDTLLFSVEPDILPLIWLFALYHFFARLIEGHILCVVFRHAHELCMCPKGQELSAGRMPNLDPRVRQRTSCTMGEIRRSACLSRSAFAWFLFRFSLSHLA